MRHSFSASARSMYEKYMMSARGAMNTLRTLGLIYLWYNLSQE